MIILLLDKLKRYEPKAINQSLTTLSGWLSLFMLGVGRVQRNDFTANFTCTVLKKRIKIFLIFLENLPPDRDRQEAAFDKGFLVEA